MDSSAYYAVLGSSRRAIFQQNNESSDKSAYNIEWMQDIDVAVLKGSARSPDQNPIKNLWGVLVAAVHANYSQFETVEDIKKAIEYEWDNIEYFTSQNLINSIQRRILALFEVRGGATTH